MSTTHAEAHASLRPSRRELLELHERLPGCSAAQLLGVPLQADAATARAAFLSLARRFHPDVLSREDDDLREQAQAIFIALEQACRHFGGHRVAPARRAPDAPLAPAPAAAQALVSAPGAALAPPRDSAPPRTQAEPEAERIAAETASRRDRLERALEAAGAAVERGEAATAVRLLHEVVALAEDGDRRRVRLLLARAYLADRGWRRYGLALLREMSDGPAPDVRALAILGRFYSREGMLARAESTLRRALEADPDDAEARHELRQVRTDRARREAAAGPAQLGEPAAHPARGARLIDRLLSFAR